MMMNKLSKDKEKKIKVAITHGDFNGISYEIMMKSLMDPRLYEMFTPVVYALPKVVGYHRKSMRLSDFNYHVISDARAIRDGKLNVRSVGDEELKIEFGKSTSVAGEYAYKALEAAVADLKQNKVNVLVTAPINKENIHSEEFHFQGHTEYLTDRFEAEESLMLMVDGDLRVGTVTNHLPLREVAGTLSESLIINKIKRLHQSLQQDFLIDRPKIAVLGLNPHSGDGGLIGSEDDTIIRPSLIQAKKQGMLVFGPFPADGFFGSGAYKKYDAVLGMYHDQSMIPFKILAGDRGVNYTAGLSIVRTSPDHGTAYDIAGKYKASAESMRQAIYLAIDIYRNRMQWQQMNANPLPAAVVANGDRRNRAENGKRSRGE